MTNPHILICCFYAGSIMSKNTDISRILSVAAAGVLIYSIASSPSLAEPIGSGGSGYCSLDELKQSWCGNCLAQTYNSYSKGGMNTYYCYCSSSHGHYCCQKGVGCSSIGAGVQGHRPTPPPSAGTYNPPSGPGGVKQPPGAKPPPNAGTNAGTSGGGR